MLITGSLSYKLKPPNGYVHRARAETSAFFEKPVARAPVQHLLGPDFAAGVFWPSICFKSTTRLRLPPPMSHRHFRLSITFGSLIFLEPGIVPYTRARSWFVILLFGKRDACRLIHFVGTCRSISGMWLKNRCRLFFQATEFFLWPQLDSSFLTPIIQRD
jgi:hypothetical protein